MEFEEFERHLAEVRRERAKYAEEFQLFEFRRASESEIALAESSLDCRLPAKYKEFMRRFGGGQFLFLDLLPVSELVAQNDFVAVAPVGSGDWWGFAVRDGVCDEPVTFVFHDRDDRELVADDFLAFLVSHGLSAQR